MRGLSDVIKRRSIFDFYRKRADIIVLQETHSCKGTEQIWEAEWGNKILFSHGETNARGVCVLIKSGTKIEVNNVYCDTDGHLVIFDVEENGRVYTCVGLYAPNKDTPSFFTKIHQLLEDRNENKILIGDYKLVMQESIDRNGTIHNNRKSLVEVKALMSCYNLSDVWRERNQNTREYTWFRGCNANKGFQASRLDFVLISRGIDQLAQNVMFLPGIKTDHRAVLLTVVDTRQSRGVGFWKFNNMLLEDNIFKEELRKEITSTALCMQHSDARQTWEKIKVRVKKFCSRYARNKSNVNNIILSQLAETLSDLQSRMPLTEVESQMYQKTLLDHEERMFERTKGLIFRSKARWYTEGEKSTKYFFNLEKSNYNAKTCFALFNNNNPECLTYNSQEILGIQRSFYSKLYMKDEEVKFELTNTHGIFVQPEHKILQDAMISKEEIKTAVFQMSKDKTPGSDGLTANFYQEFWDVLCDSFHKLVNEIYEENFMHPSALQGILNLIPKPGKDSCYIKNLRPITLLNNDYKIIEKCIVNKIMPSLHTIINHDQRGFMPGRRISVNIRKLLDIVFFAVENNLEWLIISLDFAKCFDRVSFDILNGALEYFDFDHVVRKWTNILYTNFVVKIQNNGDFSSNFAVSKGIHQGGCCSSLYFLIVAEILALEIRANPDIQGVTINKIKHILNQFADDLDLFSENKKGSLVAIFDTLEKFRTNSGFTVSYDKTCVYRIGSLRHSNAIMYDLSQVAWTTDDIKVLGVIVANDNIVEKNFKDVFEKSKSIMQAWSHRNLSLIGKIKIVNTLVASLFVYKMLVLPTMTEKMFRIIQAEIVSYIWGTKRPKIALKILQSSRKQGGLQLVDLRKKDKALKVSWVTILEQEEMYASMVYPMIEPNIRELIWSCTLDKEDVKFLDIKNNFWNDVLLA